MKFQSNVEAIVYVLYVLGGSSKKVATEDIAKKAHEEAPNRFSWISNQYSDFPDKLVVKTALEDASKNKYGGYVLGNYARDISKDGWTLTPEGIEWINENREQIENALESKIPSSSKSPIESKRFISRIKNSEAYKTYIIEKDKTNLTIYLIADLLQASPDAPKNIFELKINRLLKDAQEVKDEEIFKFLTLCDARLEEIEKIRQEDYDGQ